ncbi:MAG: type II toxin-antitoxin system VapB family antitoxin [Acidobacteria bacterium]|nr:MAG: type II toxin-antitoxin system VapB family antitoxin [Acidobacteriota bacterium]
MPTRVTIDDRLIEAAKRVGGHRTKKEAATAALREYIAHQERLRLIEMFGQVDFDPAYDYKIARRRPRQPIA